MKSRTLLILALATLLAILFAWVLQRGPLPGAPGQPLLPQLAPQLNDVRALVIEPAAGEAFRLERSADGWRAPAKNGYRVDMGKVRRLLSRLADARVVETKTAIPALHDRLGVEDVAGRPGSGVLLGVDGIEEIPPIFIGQRETRGLTGTYVRLAGDPTALLVDQDLQLERTVVDWLDREVLDIPPEDIAALQISRPDGETLRIERDDLDIFRIANMPEGFRPSGPTAAESVARALAGLRLDDVRPLDGGLPEQPPTLATFSVRDGLTIEARSWETDSPTEGATYWVAFSAAADGGEDTAARAQALNERLGPWLYRLPAWKHEQLTRRLADLVVPVGD
ncbi:MAG: DUF4340 domain-containing protein [Gammaproteobacteria bacterium]